MDMHVDVSFAESLRSIGRLPSIKKLDLRELKFDSDVREFNPLNLLPAAQRIEVFRFRMRNANDRDFCKLLHHMTRLKSLEVSFQSGDF
mmetsp:Transcript_9267/g.23176  ORF Transcript_9267/g.23176 Transcript_9267/m.23176 type:complete len:89 (-) Transcript_9267:220-486(-)